MTRRLSTPERRILDELVFYCWAREHLAGRGAHARSLAAAALERWVDAGLAHRTEGTERFFDSFEVINFMHARGVDHRDEAWWDGEVRSLRDKAQSWSAQRSTSTGGPGTCDWTSPRRLEVTLCREISVGDRAPGMRMRFGIPLPVEERGQRELSIAPIDLPPGAETEISEGLLDVRARVSADSPVIRVGVRIGVTSVGVAASPTQAAADAPLPSDVLPYLDVAAPITFLSSQLVARSTSRLAALAAEAAGSASHPWAVVEQLWERLFRITRPGFVHHDTLEGAEAPLDAALDGGYVDCRLASAILVALCRSRGIPARVVGGFQLFAYGSANHWWCEVFVGREWVPIDYGSWVLGGGDLRDPWSRAWLGALDYRLITERPPSALRLGPGVRFPNHWHFEADLASDEGAGRVTYLDARTGALLYRETVSVAAAGGVELAAR